MKDCNDCKRKRLPEGGVFFNDSRWICAECWLKFTQGRKPEKEKNT